MFMQYDKDNSLMIDKGELENLLRACQATLSQEKLEECMAYGGMMSLCSILSINKSNRGYISFDNVV